MSKFPLSNFHFQWHFVIQSSLHFWLHDTKTTPVFLILTFYVVVVDSPLLVCASMCLAKRDHCLNALLSWSDVTLACSTFHFPGSSLKSQIFPKFLRVVYAFFMKHFRTFELCYIQHPFFLVSSPQTAVQQTRLSTGQTYPHLKNINKGKFCQMWDI